MDWLIYALFAPAIYALVVFIDKFIVSKEVKDYRPIPIYSAIAGLIAGTIIWIATGTPILSPKDAGIVLATGILTLFSFVAYYKAVQTSEASTLNLLFQMGPVFILVFSFLILGERISLQQALGFFIIFFAVASASIEKPTIQKKFKLSAAFFQILIYDILWAITAVMMKFALGVNTFGENISYFSWGIALGGVLLFGLSPSTRKAFLLSLKKSGKKVMSVVMLNEVLFIVARTITYLAYSVGSVALVSVLEGTQVFYGILYGFVAMIVAPKVFKEDMSKSGLIKKFIFALLVFFGIWLIY